MQNITEAAHIKTFLKNEFTAGAYITEYLTNPHKNVYPNKIQGLCVCLANLLGKQNKTLCKSEHAPSQNMPKHLKCEAQQFRSVHLFEKLAIALSSMAKSFQYVPECEGNEYN